MDEGVSECVFCHKKGEGGFLISSLSPPPRTWLYASDDQAPPTLGAPSCRTASKAAPPDARFRAAAVAGVVMSPTSVLQPATARILSRSTPTMREPTGRALAATCSQPPGAAHRSSTERAPSRKPNWRFSWMSLKAARERNLRMKAERGEGGGQGLWGSVFFLAAGGRWKGGQERRGHARSKPVLRNAHTGLLYHTLHTLGCRHGAARGVEGHPAGATRKPS